MVDEPVVEQTTLGSIMRGSWGTGPVVRGSDTHRSPTGCYRCPRKAGWVVKWYRYHEAEDLLCDEHYAQYRRIVPPGVVSRFVRL